MAVDTGGTFNDFVLYDEDTGAVQVLKLSSTPSDPSAAVLQGLEQLSERGVPPSDIRLFFHGTTVGTNALLEGTGARVGLLITEGFRGVYEVREQTRGFGKAIYDLSYDRAPALVLPDLTQEVAERVAADGSVVRPLDLETAREAFRRLRDGGAESVAVVLLFSFLNERHERMLGELSREELPQIPVSLSSDVLPQIREYYRMSTTVVNAYLVPVLSRYLTRLRLRLGEHGLPDRGLFVMQSNGGVASFEQAGARAVTTSLSGPAGGVMAALALGREIGRSELITFDIGGTSCDVSLIHRGRPSVATLTKVGGYDVATPQIDITTISAGGGTIAWIDSVGALKVGPRSAGADPGPVAYGRGGRDVTVTDCNLLLGRLGASLLGGGLSLDRQAAAEAIDNRIAQPLKISPTEAAGAVLRLMNVSMEEAIKATSSQRGYDLRSFYLVAFGGGGPVHACRIAKDLGMQGVVVPLYPGVMSALGLLLSDVRHDYVRSRLKVWDEVTAPEIRDMLSELARSGRELLSEEGFPEERISFEYGIDLRYQGQGYELTVPLDAVPSDVESLRGLRVAFDRLHEERFGHLAPEARAELVAVRVAAVGRVDRPRIEAQAAPTARRSPSSRLVHFPETGAVPTPVYQRSQLEPGAQVLGPAIIEQYDTTIVVDPGFAARVEAGGHLVLRSGSAGD